ncbi:hypothetical protein [Mucilaginibacter sp.]|uniref:hypothetical protein n=1 Tax=Mucilaginibacter sp. TaxID=1882438 RepID=UPI0035BBE913
MIEKEETFQERAIRLLNLSDEEVLGLSGFYGVHKKSEIETIKPKITRINEVDFVKINISFKSSLIRQCNREINIQNNAISNNGFFSNRVIDRSGLLCLQSQIEFARKHQLKRIYLTAFRDEFYETGEYYNGYYSWGRYGFLMNRLDQQSEFLTMMHDHNYEETNIHDLVKYKQGRDFWVSIRTTWEGYFDLHLRSTSSLIFTDITNLLIKT